MSIKDLFKNFVDSFLNFDVKVLRSLRDVWVPNKITKAYVSGKRTNYIHPFRFYFICLVMFFGLLSLNLKNISFADGSAEKAKEDFALFDKFQKIEADLDSLEGNEALHAMEERLFGANIRNDSMNTHWINIGYFNLDSMEFTEKDLITLEPDSIISKYGIKGRTNQFAVHQMVKMKNSPGNMARTYIQNMLWGIILTTILMSFVLKLLFIRHKSYIVEHFLHISHFHCLLLLVISVLLIINLWTAVPVSAYLISIGFAILFFHYSLKRYYNQGFFKIFVKSQVILFSYIFALSIVVAIIFIFTAVTF